MALVYDYRTGKQVDVEEVCRGVVKVSNDCIEYGYFSATLKDIFVKTDQGNFPILDNSILDYTYFDGSSGYYTLILPLKRNRGEINLKRGRGRFPYSFSQKYEAIHNFDVFKDSQYLDSDEISYKYSKFLPYTFGMEFETCVGYIPQDICFRDGLIPLRDGSIGGLEYSTIVLNGNRGLNFLKQQINTLNKYTCYDKECSLHMHIGVPNVNKYFIWNLYVVLIIFQNELVKYVPKWTFESNRYKATRKNYCSKLPLANNFHEFYSFITGEIFDGSLTNPHRNDPDRTHKWNVHSRYFDFNFVNLLCYEKPKTIEFRFLRPTYNFAEIETWLYVFMGLITFADKICKDVNNLNFKNVYDYIISEYGKINVLFKILKDVYPKELSDKLIYRMKIINNIHTTFANMQDYAGLTNEVKQMYFDNTTFNNDL